MHLSLKPKATRSHGNVTLKTMQTMAEAMGCRFVYAVLPPKGKNTEDIIFAQAMKKAKAITARTDEHMALEGQNLFKATLENQIERLAHRLAVEMASDFWNGKSEARNLIIPKAQLASTRTSLMG